MTSVPSSVTTSIKACTTATGPPLTQPSLLREECTSKVIPASTPSARRSRAKLSRVRGIGVSWIKLCSLMWDSSFCPLDTFSLRGTLRGGAGMRRQYSPLAQQRSRERWRFTSRSSFLELSKKRENSVKMEATRHQRSSASSSAWLSECCGRAGTRALVLQHALGDSHASQDHEQPPEQVEAKEDQIHQRVVVVPKRLDGRRTRIRKAVVFRDGREHHPQQHGQPDPEPGQPSKAPPAQERALRARTNRHPAQHPQQGQ